MNIQLNYFANQAVVQEAVNVCASGLGYILLQILFILNLQNNLNAVAKIPGTS